jgi:hypothetical protein
MNPNDVNKITYINYYTGQNLDELVRNKMRSESFITPLKNTPKYYDDNVSSQMALLGKRGYYYPEYFEGNPYFPQDPENRYNYNKYDYNINYDSVPPQQRGDFVPKFEYNQETLNMHPSTQYYEKDYNNQGGTNNPYKQEYNIYKNKNLISNNNYNQNQYNQNQFIQNKNQNQYTQNQYNQNNNEELEKIPRNFKDNLHNEKYQINSTQQLDNFQIQANQSNQINEQKTWGKPPTEEELKRMMYENSQEHQMAQNNILNQYQNQNQIQINYPSNSNNYHYQK